MITDAWERAQQAASRHPLTVRDLAEAVDELQNLRDAMSEFADNPPAEKPIKIHVEGENFNRQFPDAEAMARYIQSLIVVKNG